MSFKYYELNRDFVDDGSNLAEMIKKTVRDERERLGMDPDPRAEPTSAEEREGPCAAIPTEEHRCTEATIVPIDKDWARCTVCGDDTFPITMEAAYGENWRELDLSVCCIRGVHIVGDPNYPEDRAPTAISLKALRKAFDER